ncbi:Oxidoreductase P35 [Neolewinella maritima]|uniref:Oxidoreductase P35 n=1 Tax=Neolewinella maritima TaxID=1383882 RepID=A0ABM9B1H3_9BACT|nr:Gfo/Idh/MocA family oxidoreductase [Neolewinella maritima]CAH1001182.1 Oxidoreductase P35 [Neolewinella maritima]
MPTPLNWAIIGCGDVTEVKSGPAYQQTPGFRLAAVMRRDAEKLQDYATRHGVPRYTTDAEALINDPAIDAVYIATPPDSHKYYALKVAAAGKPCCIEKPLAPSYAESLAICTAFREQDVPLFVAYYRRTLPRFQRVKQWLDEQAIGPVRHVNWLLHKPPSAVDLSGADNWRTDPQVAPGGYFDDLASHGLDLFTFLLGNIKRVHGVSLNQQGLYGAKDAFAASWLHHDGITGAGSWNFGCDRSVDRVEVYGRTGVIRFSVFTDAPVVLDAYGRQEEEHIPHPATVQLPHVRAMARQLLGQDYTHPASGVAALHTSWVMDQILAPVAPPPTT